MRRSPQTRAEASALSEPGPVERRFISPYFARFAHLENAIRNAFPDLDGAKSMLRRGLLEIVVDRLPTSVDEWSACIPADERQATDQRQLRFLEDVFKITRRVHS